MELIFRYKKMCMRSLQKPQNVRTYFLQFFLIIDFVLLYLHRVATQPQGFGWGSIPLHFSGVEIRMGKSKARGEKQGKCKIIGRYIKNDVFERYAIGNEHNFADFDFHPNFLTTPKIWIILLYFTSLNIGLLMNFISRLVS